MYTYNGEWTHRNLNFSFLHFHPKPASLYIRARGSANIYPIKSLPAYLTLRNEAEQQIGSSARREQTRAPFLQVLTFKVCSIIETAAKSSLDSTSFITQVFALIVDNGSHRLSYNGSWRYSPCVARAIKNNEKTISILMENNKTST